MSQDRALTERYLEYVRTEKRLAARTVELYALDLAKLGDFASAQQLALTDVKNHHVRRWIASMHSRGRSGRGIALILSGWRGFYAWLGRQSLVASNPVQDVRAPKAPKPLPKALAVDDAVQFAALRAVALVHKDKQLSHRRAGLLFQFFNESIKVFNPALAKLVNQ